MNSGAITGLVLVLGGAVWFLLHRASRPVKPRNGAPTVDEIVPRVKREWAHADAVQARIEAARRAAFQEAATREARARGAQQDRELELAGQAAQWPDSDVDVENANEVTAVTPVRIPPPRRVRPYALGLRQPAPGEQHEVTTA